MFAKLRTTKYLKTVASADSASVQFANGVQRIARVHHYGLREKINNSKKQIKYSPRKLLGINSDVEGLLVNLLFLVNPNA